MCLTKCGSKREGYIRDEIASGHVTVVGCCGNGNEPSVYMGMRGNLLTRLGTFSFQGRILLHVLRFYRYFEG
jgi:hypothetical protein